MFYQYIIIYFDLNIFISNSLDGYLCRVFPSRYSVSSYKALFSFFFLFLWLLIHPRRKYWNGTHFVATGCACACPCTGAYFSSISRSNSDCSCTCSGSGSVFVAEGPVSRIPVRMLTRLNRELEADGSRLIEGQLWQHLVPCAWLSGGTGSATVQQGSS